MLAVSPGHDFHEKIEKLRRRKTSSILLIRKAPHGLRHRKGRLGIFPASFNPPTKAHVALITEAMKRFKLDEILVLLDLQAMDKRIVGAPLEERLKMLKLLFERHSRISIGLSNRSLFLEKIKSLKRLFPSPATFVFIMGFDTILRVLDKKYYRNRRRSLDLLFEACEFLVANRGEEERNSFERLFLQRGNERYKRRIHFFPLSKKFSSISSDLVREKLGEGKSVENLVPSPVLRFIKKTRLYAKRCPRVEL
jgi:nicotinate (nicotinamide) nucleotide adenylyltransferase